MDEDKCPCCGQSEINPAAARIVEVMVYLLMLLLAAPLVILFVWAMHWAMS